MTKPAFLKQISLLHPHCFWQKRCNSFIQPLLSHLHLGNTYLSHSPPQAFSSSEKTALGLVFSGTLLRMTSWSKQSLEIPAAQVCTHSAADNLCFQPPILGLAQKHQSSHRSHSICHLTAAACRCSVGGSKLQDNKLTYSLFPASWQADLRPKWIRVPTLSISVNLIYIPSTCFLAKSPRSETTWRSHLLLAALQCDATHSRKLQVFSFSVQRSWLSFCKIGRIGDNSSTAEWKVTAKKEVSIHWGLTQNSQTHIWLEEKCLEKFGVHCLSACTTYVLLNCTVKMAPGKHLKSQCSPFL